MFRFGGANGLPIAIPKVQDSSLNHLFTQDDDNGNCGGGCGRSKPRRISVSPQAKVSPQANKDRDATLRLTKKIVVQKKCITRLPRTVQEKKVSEFKHVHMKNNYSVSSSIIRQQSSAYNKQLLKKTERECATYKSNAIASRRNNGSHLDRKVHLGDKVLTILSFEEFKRKHCVKTSGQCHLDWTNKQLERCREMFHLARMKRRASKEWFQQSILRDPSFFQRRDYLEYEIILKSNKEKREQTHKLAYQRYRETMEELIEQRLILDNPLVQIQHRGFASEKNPIVNIIRVTPMFNQLSYQMTLKVGHFTLEASISKSVYDECFINRGFKIPGWVKLLDYSTSEFNGLPIVSVLGMEIVKMSNE